MDVSSQVTAQIRTYVDTIVENAIKEYKSGLQGDTANSISDKANYSIRTENGELSSCSQLDMQTKLDILAEEIAAICIEEGLEQIRKMGRILCVGIVCLDIIFVCDKYPDEDSEKLVEEHYWSRGGNASNTASVLAHMCADVEFFGTLVENRWSSFLTDDFQKSGVKFDKCVLLDEQHHKGPVASLVISKDTGSRTALPDFRGVTEISFADFDKNIHLGQYKWIHFEGRKQNTDIEKMMQKIEEYNKTVAEPDQIKISVEMEYPRSVCPELFCLFRMSDVVFISKDYAKDAGYDAKEDAVNGLYKNSKQGAILICPWGDQGAAARQNEETFTSPAFPPERLLDTIGAGDTFNAATIYALYRGRSLDKVLEFACKVAGAKCGSRGFTGVKGMQTLL